MSIKVRNLIITGGDQKILSTAHFNLDPKENMVLFGPGGSGKSLLLKFLAGILAPNLHYQFEHYTGLNLENVYLADYNDQDIYHVGEFPKLTYDHYLIDEPERAFSFDQFYQIHKGVKEMGQSMIFASHHLGFVESFADQILVLRHGAFKGIYSKFDFFNNTDPYISQLAKLGC